MPLSFNWSRFLGSDARELIQELWREHEILVVHLHDDALRDDEADAVRRMGDRLHGQRQAEPD